MKFVYYFVALASMLLFIFVAWLAALGRTALINPFGLIKVLIASAALAVGALLMHRLSARIERASTKRFSLVAHPATWILSFVCLILAFALIGKVAQRVTEPSMHGDWALGLYKSSGANPDAFVPLGDQPILTADHITDIPCSFVADPSLVRTDDGFVLFYEAWNTRTGHGDICLSTSKDGSIWTYGGRVLDEPCSLSYPTVFKFEGTWYMIPETRALDSIRLYRAIRFPTRWVFEQTLLDGAPYRDTNIVQYDGHWYLFTLPGANLGLEVFHADSPFGPWEPHALNPVVSNDPDHARGGGSILSHAGRLLRFAQDVSPYYGNRVWLMEVTELSPTAFSQAPLLPEPVLVGHKEWNTMGMHTLSCVQLDSGGWLAVVDGYGRLINTRSLWRD
ncbi:hypothetical protein N9980_01865 [bacterium]|nr:hypothetical protein [bacterium]